MQNQGDGITFRAWAMRMDKVGETSFANADPSRLPGDAQGSFTCCVGKRFP